MDKILNALIEKIEKLPGKNFKLSQKGNLSVSSKNKFINASLNIPENGVMNLLVHDSNYNQKYLKKFLSNDFRDIGEVNVSFYPGKGDLLWIYPQGDPQPGQDINIDAQTIYYRYNNGEIACEQGLGTFGKNCTATFINKKKDKCDSGTTMVNYYEILLK